MKSPQYISDRVELFVNEQKKKIEDITEDEYKKHVDSIKIKKIEEDYTLNQQISRFWKAINEHHYEFNRSKYLVD